MEEERSKKKRILQNLLAATRIHPAPQDNILWAEMREDDLHGLIMEVSNKLEVTK